MAGKLSCPSVLGSIVLSMAYRLFIPGLLPLCVLCHVVLVCLCAFNLFVLACGLITSKL